ncbi:phage tail protein [Staphylococcus nepalensis]|uniref:phage tail protein n=1 Tax=Staphylococcus nepalensis TaxID=214473 RepID=UPI0032E9384F
MFIRDLDGEEYFLQGVINHEQELNGDERIDIEIEYTDMNSEFLSKQDDLKMWIILFEGKEYRIISSKQTGFGDKYRISVTAVLYMLDWLNSHRVYERIDASLTVTEAFNIVFNDTPFTYTTVESAPSNHFEGIGEGETRLEIFKTFIDRYGYEFKIVGNVVYLYNQIGNDANFEYRYKVNTQNIEKEVDASEMWTYARGYGNYSDDDSDTDVVEKAKLKREYTSPLEKIIGERREAPPIRDGRITHKETMDANLKKIVDESVQISFTADIYDMSQQGYDYQHAVLGDRVFLVDERIGLDTEIRVVKITRNFSSTGQILDLEITFGSGNMADQYGSNLSTAAKDIADLIQGRKSLPFQALDIISKSMVTKIQNTTSEIIYDTNGQHFMDKKNNNNIMTMNSSGLLLSTDGGRTAKTAITAEGVVADTITTGTLNANLISVRGGDNTNSIEITNDMVNSEGIFTRTWANITDTARLNLGIRQGRIMVSNEDTGYNLYMTEKGLSTMMAGAGDETAGTLEFHSQRFNETSRGVTLHSTYGAVALLSENSRVYSRSRLTNNIESDEYGIYLRPFMKTRKGLNEFNFYVKEADSAGDTDGAFLYGNLTDANGKHGSGIRFSKSISGNTIYATNQEGDIGTGDFYADKLFGDWKSKTTNLYAMTAYDGELRVTDKSGYNNGNMTFRPVAAKSFNQVSSLKYKTNIENVDDIGLSTINNLTVVKYSLKSDIENGDDKSRQLGFIAEYSEPIATSEKSAIDIYKLLSYNTKALQELHGKFIEQQKRLEGLENERTTD